MTFCDGVADPVVHQALRARFSPTLFDRDVEVTDRQIDTLLDAAGLAPSAGNSQPWSFIVGRRGDRVHGRVCSHLAPSAARWAADASLIVVNLAQIGLDEAPDWEYSEFSRYDLGQAVAHMTIQGLSIGLDSHQFRAFDRAAVAGDFDVPQHWEVVSMTAFGVAAHAADAPTAPGTSRERRSRADITWARG